MSDAFSAGLGMAMGLLMRQHLVQAMEAITKQDIICQNCTIRNPIENKFCSHCGQSLLPLLQITCQKCKEKVSRTIKFCGYCGSLMKKKGDEHNLHDSRARK
ncbi:MAG: zinc ribbon domain-containing protein [Candidatus Bathyarchaeota archaeon]|nr:MAG: zinc ribbon domain-containing protein [Candidatus Bathyarchaeota archaeon]